MRRKGVEMPPTYRAVLHGNRLEWRDQKPEGLLPDRGVEVVVTILRSSDPDETSRTRRAGMATALERLAAAGGPKSFGDPTEWERETREESALPKREP